MTAAAPSSADSHDQTPPRPRVKAVLTVFEGQAVYRLLPPGTEALRAGDLFRVPYGSRTIDRERP